MKLKCIIFGASKTGNAAYRLLKEQYDVIGFADNNSKKWGELFCEKEIYSPDELPLLENVEIIIASVYYASIYKQLKELGISRIQVFFLKGAASDNKSKEYALYQLSNEFLFQDCKYDEWKIEKIRKNFSENYPLPQKEEKLLLKQTHRKKVLFCAYIFPPLGGAGVQRSLKFVKYLRDFGYEPIILTVGENDGKLPSDETLLKEIPNDITVIRIDYKIFLPECLPQENQQEIFNLYCGVTRSKAWIKQYAEVLNSVDGRLIPDNQMIWVNECLKQIEQKLDLSEIDIVYTTGNPYSTYFLGFYIKMKYGIKWVQDYRDPWMTNRIYLDNYRENVIEMEHLQKQLEKQFNINADAILVVAGNTIAEYVNEYGISRKKIFEITNGYDEDDFTGIIVEHERNPKFTLCYNGMIYLDRNPLKLLIAINELIDEKQILADDIEWVFNGTFEKDWRPKIEALDKYKIVRCNGYLTHLESIESAMRADILVLFGAEGEATKIFYTGKVFEYIRMRKPILSFSTEGGVLTDILAETETGENFEYGDIENVKKYLVKKYSQWKRGEQMSCGNEEAIKRYSRESITRKLGEIFDKLLGCEQRGRV